MCARGCVRRVPASSPTHSLTGVPAVLAALTLLRRLSNQSASEPPASSAVISRTAGRSEGCVTEAEGTVQEVREEEVGKWMEKDE